VVLVAVDLRLDEDDGVALADASGVDLAALVALAHDLDVDDALGRALDALEGPGELGVVDESVVARARGLGAAVRLGGDGVRR